MEYLSQLVTEQELIHWTEHHHCYVNPYYGCTEDCPFCYWHNMNGWSNAPQIRFNSPEVFAQFIGNWNKEERIYIGSCCNPYEDIEKKYQLTHRILEIIRDRNIKCALMTCSENVLDDIELFMKMKENLTIVIELARIERMIQFNLTGVHKAMDAANILKEKGIDVIVTLSPYMHGITNMEAILSYLRKDIDLYFGSLDIKSGKMSERFLKRVTDMAPGLVAYYENLIDNQLIEEEFERVYNEIKHDIRVKLFPLPL